MKMMTEDVNTNIGEAEILWEPTGHPLEQFATDFTPEVRVGNLGYATRMIAFKRLSFQDMVIGIGKLAELKDFLEKGSYLKALAATMVLISLNPIRWKKIEIDGLEAIKSKFKKKEGVTTIAKEELVSHKDGQKLLATLVQLGLAQEKGEVVEVNTVFLGNVDFKVKIGKYEWDF